MFERFAQATRVAVDDAKFEAARRGDRRIGTDHLLIGVLHDDTVAIAIGTDAHAARRAAAELDRRALAAIGVELGDAEPGVRAALGKHTPFTAGAKQVLAQTVQNAATEKARTLTTRHLALALIERAAPDPATALLDALGVHRAEARQRLAVT
ncbi:Clp protease N-terminal domain-containing protein [Humibacter antri]